MRCSAEEFTCGDGSCIDARRHCDNNEDCPDGSDEANCGQSTNKLYHLTANFTVILGVFKAQETCLVAANDTLILLDEI